MSTLHQRRQLCPRSTNTSHSREQNNGCGGGGATLGQGGIFSISHALLKAGGGCLQQALLVLETTGEASPVLPWLLSSHQGKAIGSGTKLGEQGKAGQGKREDLRMGQGRHPCFLVETMANHFNPIPFLITDAKGDKCPHPPAVEDQRTPGIFGDGSPMPHGRGRGAGLFLHQDCSVTSELPTPFQGDVICQQKLVQEDGEF